MREGVGETEFTRGRVAEGDGEGGGTNFWVTCKSVLKYKKKVLKSISEIMRKKKE